MDRPLRLLIGFFAHNLSRHFVTMANSGGDALLCIRGKYNVHIHHVHDTPHAFVVSVTVDLRDERHVIRSKGDPPPKLDRLPLFERTYDIRDPAFNPDSTIDQIMKACSNEAPVCHH